MNEQLQSLYDDNYGTCKYTTVALCIIHPALEPEVITQLLRISPSWAWRKGEPREWKGRPARTGMWVLSSENNVFSRDVRRHLDWLITELRDCRIALTKLAHDGYTVDVFCHWVQLGGTGGPTLSPTNMRGLADLGLELGFEFWSEDEEDEDATESQTADGP